MANEQEIIEVITEILALPAGDIDTSSHLHEDLGLNPVEIADLFNGLAKHFNIFFDQADISQSKTIGNLVELVEDKLLE